MPDASRDGLVQATDPVSVRAALAERLIERLRHYRRIPSAPLSGSLFDDLTDFLRAPAAGEERADPQLKLVIDDLEWLNSRGGLGLDTHERLRADVAILKSKASSPEGTPIQEAADYASRRLTEEESSPSSAPAATPAHDPACNAGPGDNHHGETCCEYLARSCQELSDARLSAADPPAPLDYASGWNECLTDLLTHPEKREALFGQAASPAAPRGQTWFDVQVKLDDERMRWTSRSEMTAQQLSRQLRELAEQIDRGGEAPPRQRAAVADGLPAAPAPASPEEK